MWVLVGLSTAKVRAPPYDPAVGSQEDQEGPPAPAGDGCHTTASRPRPPAHCLGTGHTQEEGLRFLKAQCDSESLPEGNADKEGQDPELAEST